MGGFDAKRTSSMDDEVVVVVTGGTGSVVAVCGNESAGRRDARRDDKWLKSANCRSTGSSASSASASRDGSCVGRADSNRERAGTWRSFGEDR